MQATYGQMKNVMEDGGSSFKCADSQPWRKDCSCNGPPGGDFMTTGEQDESIPPVPKGFVRWQQLRSINDLAKRKKLQNKSDRDVFYIYCGDDKAAPDTKGLAPFSKKFAAAVTAGKSRRITGRASLLAGRPKLASVEGTLDEYRRPLKGVTLEDFSFVRPSERPSKRKAALVDTPPAKRPRS